MKREKKEVVELYYDFQKACDNVNRALLKKLLEVYGFPPGIQILVIEMMSRGNPTVLWSEGGRRGPT